MNDKNMIYRLPEFLYHYTDINALIGILQKEKIVLRATNVLFLNDPSELQHGIGVVNKMLNERINNFSFRSYYITSFSESKDNLSMWRAYADNGKGCAIEFDIEVIKKIYSCQHGFFKKCIYDDNELINDIMKKNLQLSINGRTAQMPPNANISYKQLNEQVKTNDIVETCLKWKNAAYKEENEWRGVYCHYIENDKKEIKFRERDGIIIPYIEIEIPTSALKSVILGPSSNISLNSFSVMTLFKNNGYKDKEIYVSEIPYRG